jgi:exodeoxyribonuclease VII large subunit
VGRRLAAVRTRLIAADNRAAAAVARRRHRADALLGSLAGRLDSLSPLAVLGRGYAVCWNGERTALIRDARQVVPGDRVNVTLDQGEIECDVRGTKTVD